MTRPPARLCWRGAKAPEPAPAAAPLAGTIDHELISSAALGAARAVTVYRPPGHPEPLPICILADGQSVPVDAAILEAAVLAGEVPAVLLAGIHNAPDPARNGPDGRTREYIPGFDRARFRGHLRFVTDDVLPCLRGSFAVTDAVVAAGTSNGAAWAIAAAQRRADVFSGVAALSPGMVPRRISRASRTAGVRHYLASGILEPGFRRATQEWASRLRRAKMPLRHHEWAGGHDDEWWCQQLPIALAWLLAGRSSTPGP